MSVECARKTARKKLKIRRVLWSKGFPEFFAVRPLFYASSILILRLWNVFLSPLAYSLQIGQRSVSPVNLLWKKQNDLHWCTIWIILSNSEYCITVKLILVKLRLESSGRLTICAFQCLSQFEQNFTYSGYFSLQLGRPSPQIGPSSYLLNVF